MPVGEPGGPDSEVFYDFGTDHDKSFGQFCHPNCDCGRFLEIGNSVFMAYKRTEKGFEKLPKPNVDFGGGLERIAAAKIGESDMFKISLLWPIIQKLEELSNKKYDEHQEPMRVIADHVRASVFLAVDGVVPSNNEQGYVSRRLLRRAIRFAFDLGIESDLLKQIVPKVVDMYSEDYPEFESSKQNILDIMDREEKLFRKTLARGLRMFNKTIDVNTGDEVPRLMSGGNIFVLYDTYGFPVELSLEEAEKRQIKVDPDWQKDFDSLMKQQRERSQTAGKGVFKGGLADHSEETTKLHTSHHLLLKALKDKLGDHVVQRGSNITAERLRIDFSHPEKVQRDVLDEIEGIVNQKIQEDLPVIRSEMAREDAMKLNGRARIWRQIPRQSFYLLNRAKNSYQRRSKTRRSLFDRILWRPTCRKHWLHRREW